MKKRLLSMLLVFVMLLGILPVGALAAEPENYDGYSFVFLDENTCIAAQVASQTQYRLVSYGSGLGDSYYTFYLEKIESGNGYHIYMMPDNPSIGVGQKHYLGTGAQDGKFLDKVLVSQVNAGTFYVEKRENGDLVLTNGRDDEQKRYVECKKDGNKVDFEWDKDSKDAYVLTLMPGQGGGSQSAVVRFYVKWHEPAKDEIAYDYYYNDVTEKDGTTPLNRGTEIQGKLKIASGYVLVGDSPIYGQVIEGLSEGGEGASGADGTATWVAQCTGITVPTISSAVAALNAAKSAHSLPINVGSEDGYSAITYESVAWSSSDKAYHVHMTLCPKTIHITYDGNGGQLSDGSTTKTADWTYDPVGYSVANNANGFSRTGYTFGGWYYKAESGALTGTNLQGTKIAPTANTTLFAKWELNT